MAQTVLHSGDISTLSYVITQVFFPPKLPGWDDHSVPNDHTLARAVATAAHLYGGRVNQADLFQWQIISKMLENLQAIAQSESLDMSRTIAQFGDMNLGDILALPVRAQNEGVIFRKQEEVTIYEAFELSPNAHDVLATEGKLICSYPGPAIEIPNSVFHDKSFRSEVVNFLVRMSRDKLHTPKQGAQLAGSSNTNHPLYITELLTGILRSVGCPADVSRISKRVDDDICGNPPWRRSTFWLLIRVALQTTLDRSPSGNRAYKEFMLFFMCCLATEKNCVKLPSDLLQPMLIKISRRLHKLGSSASNWLSHTALRTCTSLRCIIESRWREVQVAQRLSPPWTPSRLNLTRDIRLSLWNSRHHLAKILAHGCISLPHRRFQPKHRRRGDLEDFLSVDGRFFDEAYKIEPHVTLYDVERTVELGIDSWIDRVTNNVTACVKLEILADKYSSSALKTYANNPELLSVMLLTTIELWVALDKIAIKEIPILTEYSPEIPISLLENLLLNKTASIHRLRSAHGYLRRRYADLRSQMSVFSTTITTDSFAVRYYRTSSHLQRVKTRIEQLARFRVRKKITEMWARNVSFHQRRRIEEMTDSDLGSTRMQMGVYEWPLPADQLQAEVVVFELDCPIPFNMWRTATYRILVDLCSPVEQCELPPTLNKYSALKPYLVKHPRSRLSLGFDVARLHLHPVPIPAQKEQICVQNGRTFFSLDTRTGVTLSKALPRNDNGRCYTYELQRGPYVNLQKYVGRTSHTSNEVIANQADCREDLSIHEYMAFGHLRSGGLLQWFNILRELRARSLNFRRPEVHMLFAQAAFQVGPLESADRQWHQEIAQPAFRHALLRELESLLQDVEANWMEGVTMDTISFLLRRLLVSDPHESVSRILLLLRTVRDKVFAWVQELSQKLADTPGDEWLRGILRDTAAICRGTYNVDPVIISQLLQSPEDIEIFLSSAIIIHQQTPGVSSLPAYSRLLLNRNLRLSLTLESAVTTIILSNTGQKGLNNAVRRMWTSNHPDSQWHPLSGSNSRWISCTAEPRSLVDGDQSPHMIHLNLLDGSLLIDGRQLGRCLPNEYMQHPLYKQTFGEHVFMVVQSNLTGTSYFTTQSIFKGHQVYFSLRKKGSKLVIRARRESETPCREETLQLISHDMLEGDIPRAFIEGHAHWLNVSTSIIEVRPLDRIWETSPENWRIDYNFCRPRMWRGNEFLVDIRSPSWKMVSGLFLPLGNPNDLVITVSPTDPTQPASLLHLCVLLPRYDLSFYVDADGDLQCRDIRGMVYDEDQSIGTLFGLENQLILRPKLKGVNTLELIPRCVVIPDGEISYKTEDHHVWVRIKVDDTALKKVSYQTYTINTELGCLVGNGSLTSKLYCTYLHALTSGSSPDPLTGRTGTEEALALLQSASCCSDMRFGTHDAELLGFIASVCPSRSWNSEQNTQTVGWRGLPAYSQHPELYFLSKSIKERHQRLVQLFHDSTSDVSFERFPEQNYHLLKRSGRHAVYAYPFQISGQQLSVNVDVQYSRDLMDLGSEEHRAYTTATYVYSRTATSDKDIWGIVESWGKIVSGDAAFPPRYDQSRTRAVPRNTWQVVRSWWKRNEASSFSLQYNCSWLCPNLPAIWIPAYNALRKNDEGKWFQMLFSLSAMAYASSDISDLVPVFVAFASHPQFRLEDPPPYGSYSVGVGCYPAEEALRKYVIDCSHPFERRPKRLVRRKGGECPNDSHQREMYDKKRNADADATAQQLLRAWPCETPPPCSLNPRLYNVSDLESKIRRHFSVHFRNLQLKKHIARIQVILNGLHSMASVGHDTIFHPFRPTRSIHTPSRIPWRLVIDQLFTRPAPQLQIDDMLPRRAIRLEDASIPDLVPLHHLISTLESRVANPFQHQYVSALRTSAESFSGNVAPITRRRTKIPAPETLMEHYTRCRASYIKALDLLQRRLAPISESERMLEQSGRWPRFTPHALFRCLASNSPITVSDDWKMCLTTLALLALTLQRARRLILLQSDDLREEFCRELANEGCEGWDAPYPDWLLIQLEGNFLIRRVQAELANEMISPRSGSNTAMQFNMGEGKSSVIVPITAAILANGDQLVRVIVPKSLLAETFQLLANRLGGLTNRRIYYLPFSRLHDSDDQKVESLYETILECMRERGILVVQPDHVLSLKLASVEKQLSRKENDNKQAAYKWLELQRWLHTHSRDVLDEIDEILDVRSQLIFTIGRQQHVEGSPERWTTTGQVLDLVRKYASSLQEGFQFGVEYEPGSVPGAYPYLRILQTDAGTKLVSLVVQDIMDGHLPNVSMRNLRLSPDLDDAIKTFISCEDVSLEKVELVKKFCAGAKDSLWSGLLLLRGLFATGILMFVFTEWRWRVNYGLAPKRTMLAVPYRAKDVPSPRAEFGHPDTAIIVTYLSYYYGGLGEEQLRVSFDILLKQHDPSLAYDLWIRACGGTDVPGFLRKFNGVNLKSTGQWNDFLKPLFSRNRATIDFYLSNVVFPREAKVFPSSLSSSGWDLAERRECLATGFSGTNDGQYLFPTDISQRDPDHQQGTNAKVLSYILQPENKHYMCITRDGGMRRTTLEFLQILVAQKIRVLLDVGAQMLDLDNHKLAKTWLDTTPLATASAAIYFNKNDELMVCTRDGSTQSLQSSPFAQQIDRCLAYLDDAHTRGTNIKFPSGFRAAVTLGPRVTKDRLVQGCMRMRKLGNGHSIMFVAPIEVDRCIRAATGKKLSDNIDTVDILRWAIQETWDNILRWVPRWAQQGVEHASRHVAWSNFCDGSVTPDTLATILLQPEVRTLEDLYEPRTSTSPMCFVSPDMRQRCADLGIVSCSSACLDEEQEREVEYEVRRQRQVQPPRIVSGASHSVHPELVKFVMTGIIPVKTHWESSETRAESFKPIWDTLHATSAATNEAQIWSQYVLVTPDFEKTVEASEKTGDYLRPVHWVISAKNGDEDALVIISPHEASYLLGLQNYRSSSKVHLHLYTPRITRSTKSCNDLALYNVPPVPDSWIVPPSSVMDRLSLFSGQLYLEDYEAYMRLCNFLGVYARDLEGVEGIITEPDGFILPKNRGPLAHARDEITPTFQTTPLISLKELINLRYRGIDYSSTHMGKLLQGRTLSNNDFDHTK